MDESEVLTQTLNATLQRHARVMQGYETEIANMMAEIIRLRAKIDELSMPQPEKSKS